MSDVLAVLEKASGYSMPKLSLRCAGCGRVYATNVSKARARALRWCSVCKPTYSMGRSVR